LARSFQPKSAVKRKIRDPGSSEVSCSASVGSALWDRSASEAEYQRAKQVGLHGFGEIDEIIIDATNKATFAVLEVGGLLGLGAHRIAVPYESLKIDPAGKRIDLPGSTKETLKALPEITYEQ
jgi:hypothetical protein